MNEQDKKKNKWANYWSRQSDPRHAINDDNFYKELSKEIIYHLGILENKKILELGCGDGALLKYLPINADQYTGVDFSENLLELFGRKFPNYHSLNKGAIEYLQETGEKFDIIFSFGLLQYFDDTELLKLFELQKKAMNSKAIAVHFGIPVEEQKHVFLTGQGAQNASKFKKRRFLKQLKSRFRNNIGNWHKLHCLYKYSESCGFSTKIYGNINYLYRVNLYQRAL